MAILAFGVMVRPALAAGEQLDATVVNMRFIKPLDETLIRQLAEKHTLLVTIEEGCIAGGAGSACLELLATMPNSPAILQLGFPDKFIEHGDPALLLRQLGLDAAGIQSAILDFLAKQGEPAVSLIDQPPGYTQLVQLPRKRK